MRNLLLALLLAAPGLAQAQPILIEAEALADRGGWVVDPQFMDTMGSPYLLAHGLGRPVADARTRVAIPAAGRYRVLVRTKDWVARWNAPGTPGRFQVVIDGVPLATTFGTVGAAWHWQDGGFVELRRGEVQLALHDLTGFEGRCDAVLLTRDARFTPPNADPALAAFRRQCLGLPERPVPVGEFDFVVTGGGIAGICAAVSAARLGLRVALVQDRPVLGGNNSSEVRVWLHGARNKLPWPRVGDLVAELEQARRAHYGPSNTADLYEDGKKLAVVQGEPNITLLLEHRMNGVEMDGKRIRAIHAQQIRTGRRVRIGGRWFADCTGDACVGALAGADFDLQRTDHMGPCNLWNVCECDDDTAINTASAAAAGPVAFPRCPWALDLADKPFPGRSKLKPDPDKLGGWYWESGFDRHPIEELEYVRDWNFRAMYGAWDALKNVDKVLPNHRLNWSAFILGKRESRRLLGDVVLDRKDLQADRKFPDGAVPTGWTNDIHHPDKRYEKGFEGEAFIAKANHGQFPARRQERPFWIPYRCLYSRNIDNLLMAGRCISVTHDALGAVRVMRTCGCEGEVIGMAASLCKQHGVDPRGVYAHHLADLQALLRRGVGKRHATDSPGPGPSQRVALAVPKWLDGAPTNLARRARVIAPAGDGPVRAHLLLNDGNGQVADNGGRWVHRGALPHVVEFHWDQPVELGAARIISGYHQDARVVAPLAGFRLQWHDGTSWRDATGAIEQNTDPAWARRFPPVTTRRARLVVHATKGGISRIWEVELYGAVGKK